MIIAAIIVGIFIMLLLVIMVYLDNNTGNFDSGLIMGFIMSVVVEIILVANIIEGPQPTAMDVYQNKTTLKYTVINGIKTDSIVIFKE